ncbi:MAG TPA: ABC transporter ATP-binding protein [Tichowtungia sp.]|nr:ABC transporter ATP-binding protein [Tichowtungia sp.]
MIGKAGLNKVLEPLSTVRRVLPILWASARGWSIVAGVLLILEITFGLLSLYLIKNLVDGMTTLLAADDPAGGIETVLWQVAAFGGATLAFLTVRGLANLAREIQGMAVADYMDRMIHTRAINCDLSFYESPRYFDTLQRARAYGAQRPAQVTSNILLLAKNLVMLAAVIFLLASISWMLLPILAFAIIPALLVRMHFTRGLYEWRRRRTAMERRAGYLDWLMTSDIHAKELRLNQLGSYLQDWYSELRNQLRNENFEINKRRTRLEILVGAVATVVFFLALAYLALETAAGRNSVGDLVLFLLIFQRAQGMGQEIVTQISRFYEDHLYLGMLFEFLEIRPSLVSPDEPQPVPEQLTAGIEMENVSFTYPGCREQVLHDINLVIPPGKVIALVGANGSGKTSLIKLLARLYDPTEGRILVDGQDARTFDLEDYRRMFSVIFQDFSRYADTVRENIRFGDIRLPPGTQDVEDAARRAGADDFIRRLLFGYDTLLSRMFEEGQEISVGEWQKIALARAFMNRSRIIILDEPTSALDPNAEFELFENFKERIGGRSAVIISHRLSTIRMADYIYVLGNEKIAEQGHHEDLMAIGGLYYQAFNRQGKYYQEIRHNVVQP